LQHLNVEERNTLESTCLDYQEIFYLPGDTLSCTNATRHSITLVPGTAPINTRPYRLPEAQKIEREKQVTKLANEGIIDECSSPSNSPLLIVPKKADASVEVKWRLVVDFRKLNEKTVGNAYPLPEYYGNFGPARAVPSITNITNRTARPGRHTHPRIQHYYSSEGYNNSYWTLQD
jgi:hypothetical protein